MDDFAHIKYCNPEMSSDACRKLKSEKKPHHHPALFQHIGKFILCGALVFLNRSVNVTYPPFP